jgi:hypothetical protein
MAGDWGIYPVSHWREFHTDDGKPISTRAERWIKNAEGRLDRARSEMIGPHQYQRKEH